MLLRWQPCSSLCLQLARGGVACMVRHVLWLRCVCGGSPSAIIIIRHQQPSKETGSWFPPPLMHIQTSRIHTAKDWMLTAAHGQRWVMPGFNCIQFSLLDSVTIYYLYSGVCALTCDSTCFFPSDTRLLIHKLSISKLNSVQTLILVMF